MPGQEAADFAPVLAAAIKARGLTLESLRRRLEERGVTVSVATLSYWQNGRSLPTRAHSQNTLGVLEEVLDVEPGTLTSMAPVTPARRRTNSARRQRHAELPRTVDEAMRVAGLDTSRLRKMSLHLTLHVAADHTHESEVLRTVVQCLVGGTDSFPVVVQMDGTLAYQVHPLRNCSVARSWQIPEQGLVLTEMRLSRPLRLGELAMYEYRSSIPAGEDSTDFGIALPRLQELVLEVQFAPTAVPRRVVGYTRTVDHDPGMDSPDAVELPLAEGLAQYVRLDVPAGIYMIGWQW